MLVLPKGTDTPLPPACRQHHSEGAKQPAVSGESLFDNAINTKSQKATRESGFDILTQSDQ